MQYDVCERVSMFDGFALPYTLEQWVNYSPYPTGGQRPEHMANKKVLY